MKTQLVVTDETIDLNKFVTPFGNTGQNKPENGGFWTSTLIGDNQSDWLNFATSEGIYEDTSGLDFHSVEVSKDARVLVIDTKEDYVKALETYGMEAQYPLSILNNGEILDYEKLLMDYDALSLTRNGLSSNYREFYGWDCESTVWFNMEHLEFTLVK